MAQRHKSTTRIGIVVLGTVAFSAALVFFSITVKLPREKAIQVLQTIPVHHGGRMKPFQSFAKETVLYVTDKKSWNGEFPTATVWQWIARPEVWIRQPLIHVRHPYLKELFGKMVVNNRLSVEVVLQHQKFLDTMQAIHAKQRRREKLTLAEQKANTLYEKAYFFQLLAEGQIPGWLPHPKNPEAAWFPFSVFTPQKIQTLYAFYPEPYVHAFQNALFSFLRALRREEDLSKLQTEALAFATSLKNLREAGGVMLDEQTISRELFYWRLEPFHWAWIFYLLSVLSLLAGNGIKQARKWIFFRKLARWKLGETIGLSFFVVAFSFHAYGFWLRVLISGRAPVTNMYESVVWVSWAVAFFSLILYYFYRSNILIGTAACVAAIGVFVAEGFPAVLDPSLSPLVPVLRNNFWLTVHVLTITLGYGAFFLAWGLGHVLLWRFVRSGPRAKKTQTLIQFLYRGLQIGVILLAAGTILGGVWANYSWGRFWGWDPKETWALIALLGYLAVLHGRFTGWLGAFGFTVGAILAFLGVLMAWYGVNFVLAAGLHSYGFGGGGLKWVLLFVGLDLALIGILSWQYLRKKGTSSASAKIPKQHLV